MIFWMCILFVYLFVVGGGVYYLVLWSIEELWLWYLELMEVLLVDVVYLLVYVVGVEVVEEGVIDVWWVKVVLEGVFVWWFLVRVYFIMKI